MPWHREGLYYNGYHLAPVNRKNNKHQGGENVAASPHHHQPLARQVPRVPLKVHIVFFDKLKPDGEPTSMTTLQMVSMGIVMNETIASARVRWNTRK